MKKIITLFIGWLLLCAAGRAQTSLAVHSHALSWYELETCYDGTTRCAPAILADLLGFDGLLLGDTLRYGVDYRIDSAVFDTPAVGRNKPLSIFLLRLPTAKASYYTLTNGQPLDGVRADVIHRTIAVSGGDVKDKFYDGTTTDATLNYLIFSDLAACDTFIMGTDYTATAAFTDPKVGVSKPMEVTATMLSTPTTSNYLLYNPHSVGAVRGNIVRGYYPIEVRDRAISWYELETYYDGTTRYEPSVLADLISFSGLVDDTLQYGVDYRIDSAVFDAPTAGENKPINIYVSLLPTEKSDHYTITNVLLFKDVHSNVLRRTISLSGGSVKQKDYNGTTSAEIERLIFNNLAPCDSLVMGVDYGVDYTATASFKDPKVGNSKPVEVRIEVLFTSKTRNYILSNPHSVGTVRGNIVRGHYPIEVRDRAINWYEQETYYDGTTRYALSVLADLISFEGLVDDTLHYGTDYRIDSAVFASAAAGENKPLATFVALIPTAKSIHYTLANGYPFTDVRADVLRRIISVKGGSVKQKDYDGTTIVDVDSLIFNNLSPNDSLVMGVDYTVTANFQSPNLGSNKPVELNVTLISNSATAKYLLSNPHTIGRIKGSIVRGHYNITVHDRALSWYELETYYDGTTRYAPAMLADLLSFARLVEDTLRYGTDYRIDSAVFASAAVGENKPVDLYVSLLDTEKSSHYTLTNGQAFVGMRADVLPRTISVSGGVVKEKFYNDSTAAELDMLIFSNLASCDSLIMGVDYAVTADFIDPKVGNSKPLKVDVTLTNNSKTDNYILSNPLSVGTVTGSIVRGHYKITVRDRALSWYEQETYYDGTTRYAPAMLSDLLSFAGLVDDTLRYGTDYRIDSAVFASAAVGENKPVDLYVSLLGTEKSSHYTLTNGQAFVGMRADVLPRTISVSGGVVKEKFYNDSTAAELDMLIFSNLAPCDSLIMGVDYAVIASFTDPKVGSSKPLEVNVTLTNNSKTDNYILSNPLSVGTVTGSIVRGHYKITVRDRALSWYEQETYYDGTTHYAPALLADLLSFAGLVDDTLRYGTDYCIDSAVFASAVAGENKPVDIYVSLLGTEKSSHYTLTNGQPFVGVRADVLRRIISVSGGMVKEKFYNGSTAAEIDTLIFSNLLSCDSLVMGVDYTANASFTDHKLGNSKPVRLNVTMISNPKTDNYNLDNPYSVGTITGSIVRGHDIAVHDRALSWYELETYYDGSTRYATPTLAVMHSVVLADLLNFSGLVEDTLRYGVDYHIDSAVFDTPAAGKGKPLSIYVSLLATEKADYYTLTNTHPLTGVRADVLPRTISVSGGIVKNNIYDGSTTTTATLERLIFSDLAPCDSLVIGVDYTATASFTDPKVGNNKPVVVDVTMRNTSTSNNYLLDSPHSVGTVRGNIVRGSYSITVHSKVLSWYEMETHYDGSTRHEPAMLSDLISFTGLVDDTLRYGVDYRIDSAVFDSPAAGEGKPIDVYVSLLGSEKSGHYTLTNGQPLTGLHADILPRIISVSGSVKQKFYDRSTTAEIDTLIFSNLVSCDSLIMGVDYTATAGFTDPKLGDSKPVRLDVIMLSNSNTSNYKLDNPHSVGTVTGSIVRGRNITVHDRALSWYELETYYDGTTRYATPTLSVMHSVILADLLSFSWLVDDTLRYGVDYRIDSAVFDTPAAGKGKPLSIYVSLLATEKADYYTLTNGQPLTGVRADVLPRTISVSGGIVKNNIYDGSTTTTATLERLVFSDLAPCDSLIMGTDYTATASFIDPKVGNNKPVEVNATIIITSTTNNYIVSNPYSVGTVTGNIVRGSYSITVHSKVLSWYELETYYDGTTRHAPAILSDLISFSGLVDDTLRYGTDYCIDSAVFDSPAAGESKPIDVYVSLLGSEKSAHYTLSNGRPIAGLRADVLPRTISVSGGRVKEKFYNGSTNAEVDTLIFSNLASCDSLIMGVDYTATVGFIDPKVGNSKPVRLDVAMLSNSNTSNYILSNPHSIGTVKGSIVRGRNITVHDRALSWYELETHYDGTTRHTPIVLADLLSFSWLVDDTLRYGVDYRIDSAVFDTPAAGKGKPLSIYVSLLATEKANYYTLTNGQPLTGVRADVLPRTINVSGGTVKNNLYDGSTTTATLERLIFSDLASCDSLVIGTDYTATASFIDPKVGNSKPMKVDATMLNTPTASNYLLYNPHSVGTVRGNIVRGHYNITMHDRALSWYELETHYDGTTHHAPALLSDLFSFSGLVDDTLRYGVDYCIDTAVFDSPAIGEDKPLSIYVSLLGSEKSGHYALTNGRPFVGVRADVLRRTINVVGGIVTDNIYDGVTTTADLERLIFSDLASCDSFVMGVDYTATASFKDPRVGNSKPVEVDVTMTDNSKTSNYLLYNPHSVGTVRGNIIRGHYKITVHDRALSWYEQETYYDGTTRYAPALLADLLTFSGLVEDTLRYGVDYHIDSAVFASAAAGENKPIDIYVSLLPTEKSGHYTLTNGQPFVGVHADVLPRTISVIGGVMKEKFYDGSTTAEIDRLIFNDLASCDSLVIDVDYAITASFIDPKVGDNKPVEVDVTMRNTSTSNNYLLDNPHSVGTVTGNIARGYYNITVHDRALSWYGQETYYDGTTRYAPALLADLLTFSGLVEDTLRYGVDYRIDSAVFDSPAIGEGKPLGIYVSLLGTEKSGHYTLTNGQPFVGVHADVLPRTISVIGGVTKEKLYDGSTTAEIDRLIFNDLAPCDSFVIGADYTAIASFKDPKVGNNKPVDVSTTMLNTSTTSNYIFDSSHSVSTITGSIVRGRYNITVHDRALSWYEQETYYDGTTRYAPALLADLLTFSGLVEDTLRYGVDYRIDSAVFDSPAIGEGKPLSIYVSLLGTEKSGHYTLTNGRPLAGVHADVLRRIISVIGGVTKGKFYDGSTTAEVDKLIFNDLASCDSFVMGVDYTVIASFTDPEVGDNKPVEVDVTMIDNSKTSNYDFVNPHISDKITGRIYNECSIDYLGDLKGCTPTPPSYTAADLPLTLERLTARGYTFAGWYDAETAGSKVEEILLSNTGDKELWARWEANTYTIVYHGNGATGDTTPSSTHTYDVDSELIPNGFTRTGYSFAGWATTPDGAEEYDNGDTVNNLTDENDAVITLYATWTAHTYRVAYDGNGATSGTTDTSDHVYDVDNQLTQSGFRRTGYSFAGWAATPDGAKVYDNGDTVSNLTDENDAVIALYAVWTAHTYRVAYDGNGATSGATDTSDHVYDVDNQLTQNGFRRTSYSFAGWATTPDGAKEYDNGDTVSNLTDENDAVIALYAVWSFADTIIYHDPENVHNPNPTSYTTDQLPVALSDLSKEGYTFDGWYDSEAGGAKVTEIPLNSTGDKEFWARWTANTYTVVYHGNGLVGDTTESSVHTYDVPRMLTPNNFTRMGYKFAGWAASPSGAILYADVAYVHNLTARNNDMVRLYAVWTSDADDATCLVFFNANGGNESSAGMVRKGQPIAQPADPTRDGHIFDGWYKEAACTSAWDFDDPITESIMLYAKWIDKSALYTVTFESNGGDSIPPQVVMNGELVDRPDDPTKEWYKFAGWCKEDTLAILWNFPTDVVTDNITLYAKWYPDSVPTHNVTFDSRGGSAVDSQMVVREFGRVQEPKPEPTKEGYNFDGWWYYKEGDKRPHEYDFDNPVWTDFALHAEWKIRTYMVTFKSRGEIVDTQRVDHGNTAIRPHDPPGEKIGYVFDEWCSDTAFTVPWDFAASKVVQDTTLYAYWENSVIFVTYSDDTIPMQKVKAGDMLPYIPPPTRGEHYIFKGWYRDSAFLFPWDSVNSRVDDGGMVLYAGWEFKFEETWIDNVMVQHDNGKVDTAPRQTLYCTLACDDATKTLRVIFQLPDGLTSNLSGNMLTLDSLKQAFKIDTTVMISTSHAIKKVETPYTITLERKFPFDSIVHTQLGGRLLMVVNNPIYNGGYRFQRAWWYRKEDGYWINQSDNYGTLQMYYVPQTGDTMMYVRLLDGRTNQVLETCPSTPSSAPDVPAAESASVYPNPVAAGGVVHLRAAGGRTAALPAEHPAARYATYRLLDVQGRLQRSGSADELQNGLTMPSISGSYFLILEGKTGKTTMLIVVGEK